VPRHLDEVRTRRLGEITKIHSEVEARLIQEINFWDARAEELALQEAAGRNQRLNAENARGIATTLVERLNRRRTELERERQITASLPQLVAAAFVAPSGMLRQPAPGSAQAPGLMLRPTRRSCSRTTAGVRVISKRLGSRARNSPPSRRKASVKKERI
jgi:hypothetical protein